jgi:hypothetical protein
VRNSSKIWLLSDFVVLSVFICWGNTDTLGFAVFATLTSPLWVSMIILTIRSLAKDIKESEPAQENKKPFTFWVLSFVGILVFCLISSLFLWSDFRFM